MVAIVSVTGTLVVVEVKVNVEGLTPKPEIAQAIQGARHVTSVLLFAAVKTDKPTRKPYLTLGLQ